MDGYTPTTDAMVGYGVGACFVNNLGASIADGDCIIVVAESLTVSSLSTLTSVAASYDVSVTANVSWTAMSNDTWVSIDMSSGSGNATVSVTVTENVDASSRTGSVTFTQDPGGDDIVRTLTVVQEGADLTAMYDLINTGVAGDPVTVDSFSKEEVNGTTKFNYAVNTLDKDNGTVWAADDGAILAGDYKGDGEYIIYDLGSIHNLDLIQFSTTNKSDAFGFQVWVSTTGTDVSDFSMALPTSGDLLLTVTSTIDFNQYIIDADARYVKLLGYGRFNSAGDTRVSQWNAVGEIEFYGSQSLSINDYDSEKTFLMYPNPAKTELYINSKRASINTVAIYSLDGRKVFEKPISNPTNDIKLDVSTLENGTYLINLSDKLNSSQSKIFIVSN